MGKQKVVKDFDELEFRDDFMFGKVMEDRDLCRGVLECLLQEPFLPECNRYRLYGQGQFI